LIRPGERDNLAAPWSTGSGSNEGRRRGTLK
jgi:hypothetical protein